MIFLHHLAQLLWQGPCTAIADLAVLMLLPATNVVPLEPSVSPYSKDFAMAGLCSASQRSILRQAKMARLAYSPYLPTETCQAT